MENDISIGVLLQIAGRIMEAGLARVSEDIDLTTGQLAVLGMVCRYPELPQSEYGRILCINEATLGRYASRLETTGHITRSRNDPDGRIIRLSPTDEGKALFKLLGERLQTFSEAYRAASPDGNVERLHKEVSQFLKAQGWALPDKARAGPTG
ncbi:MarR family winged helix-turn-helix transcriptional regulator [Pseudoruegeria aquimaris]|uniref:MarR family winged helix-turn-helix transcriptional regulator n=1 Tax=Pseudoruegeria aquimaris TaxID=393663 RepID=UPI000A27022C|nr:MarR family transcriptional regulator [Pseudoruegeria aquimaris]